MAERFNPDWFKASTNANCTIMSIFTFVTPAGMSFVRSFGFTARVVMAVMPVIESPVQAVQQASTATMRFAGQMDCSITRR